MAPADIMVTRYADQTTPLLRSPPFAGGAALISHARPLAASRLDRDTIDTVFAEIRREKVGGDFWRPAADDTDHDTVVRAASALEVAALIGDFAANRRATIVWLLPPGTRDRATIESLVRPGRLLIGEVDPWSLLGPDKQVVAHGDDEWVALAHIARCAVRILSAGRFGEVGADGTQVRDRVADALSAFSYIDPFTGREAGIESIIAQLGDWRRTFASNRDIVAACGIAWWKRNEIARFLWTPAHALRIFRSERRAIACAARKRGAVAVWPSRVSAGMAVMARAKNVPLIRIEDGFVRSVGLGANLVPPSSVAVDRLGIHYDPGRPSDLESILAGTTFPPALLERARRLRRTILDAGISKYGDDGDHDLPARPAGRRVVLVPGQVEDDMSVRLGGSGLTSNLEVLRRARSLETEAEIWFRPHPDVDAGHRKGAIRDTEALVHANRIVRGGSMARLLERIDAVHVLTSLTGFEALLRGCEVTCHGTPFYAGWGLTHDLAPIPDRRGRHLTLDELVAGALILYPRYLDPVSGMPCPPETLIGRITAGNSHNRWGWVSRFRKLQGRLMRRTA